VQNEFNVLRVVERVIIVFVIVVMSAYNYSSIGGGRTERGPDFVPVVVHVSHHFLLDDERRKTTARPRKGFRVLCHTLNNKERKKAVSAKTSIRYYYTRARAARV
jgi:hypothetical protein